MCVYRKNLPFRLYKLIILNEENQLRNVQNKWVKINREMFKTNEWRLYSVKAGLGA